MTLTTKAMLCRMQIRMWTARRFDRDTSEEIADLHGATDAGRFNKLLLPKTALAGMQSAATALRTHHAANTLPWTLDGVGLLPATNYFPYMAEHKRLAIMFDLAKEAFLEGFAAAKGSAKVSLGDLYREDEYPTADDLAGRIGCAVNVWPLPDAGDFRVDLGNAEEARIRADIEASVNDAVGAAVRSLWQRVHDTVSAMHERLTKFHRDDDGKVKNPFRDSLVTNMRELVDLMARLNVTDDAALESMRRRLAEKLCPIDPDDLRANDELRAIQAAECAAVLDLMAAYTGAAPALAAE
ncbi:MAG TPA: hypothetical protein VN663_22705 [Ramlibacter sp.]|nr:hypothetical protein [Ramlibacter sp.]